MILINPQKTFGAFDHKILLGKKKCNKVFSAEGMEEVPPLLAKNLLILAPSGKVRTVDSPPKFLTPTKSSSSSLNITFHVITQ